MYSNVKRNLIYGTFLLKQIFDHNAAYLFIVVSKLRFVIKSVSKEWKAYMFFASDALHKKNKTSIHLVSARIMQKTKMASEFFDFLRKRPFSVLLGQKFHLQRCQSI